MQFSDFRRAGHTPSLAAALVHFDVSFMAWVMLGALGAFIGEDLGLSASREGADGRRAAAGRRVLPPAARRARRPLRPAPRRPRVDDRRARAARCTAGSAADAYGELLAIGVLLGVAGASFAISLPLASRWYPPEHQGLAMGIAGAGNSGTVITTLAAPRLAEAYGWQAVFGLALVAGAARARRVRAAGQGAARRRRGR